MESTNLQSDAGRNWWKHMGSRFGPGHAESTTWGTPYGYLFAVAAIIVSSALKLFLAKVVGIDTPFLLFPVSVLLAAWFGGVGPGLLATVLSSFFTAYFFIGPGRSLAIGSEGFVQVCVQLLESLLFCWFAFVVYNDRTRLRNSKASLEQELLERRRIEQALRESERRFRTMADQAPVMMWMSDADQRCTYLNRPRLSFTGRTLDQELGEGWAEVIHPRDRDRYVRAYEEAFAHRGDFEMEHRVRRFDGEYRWVLDRGTPRFLPTGEFAGYIGSMIDVTEQRLQAQEIRTRAAQNAIVARLGQEAIESHDLDALLQDTSTMVTEALGIEYCKVLELLPNKKALKLRAGVGWKEGCVGHMTLPADQGSQAGFTLASAEPVIVDDLMNETRFAAPALLHDHGIVSGVSVIIPGLDRPFGVLSVHSAQRHPFTRDDVSFLRAVASVLASAIERQHAERQLAYSELRYRTLFHGANDVVLVYRLNPDGSPGHYVEVNEMACRRLGYSREELLGMTPTDIADPSFISMPDTLAKLRKSGMLVTESRHVTRGGERIPMEVSAHLFEMDGKPIVLSVCRDITERKRADEERAHLLARESYARREAEAAQSRSAFLARVSAVLASSLNHQAILQTVAGLTVPHWADVCLVDIAGTDGEAPDFAAAHANPFKKNWVETFRETYRMDPRAPFGAPHVLRFGQSEFCPVITDEHWLEAAHDEAHLAALRRLGLKSVIRVPLRARAHVLGALTLAWSDSDRRYTEADVQFAEDLAARAAIALDNARLYEEAREAERQAEEMARLKSTLLANMSHEIRTPLQGVIGFASLLARQVTGKNQDYAQRIMSSGQRLMDTLNAVLTLAKLEAHQAELVLEPVGLDVEAQEIVQSFQRRAEEKGLALRFEGKPGVESVLARVDAGGFSSILHNILGNAIKFTEKGGITVSVGIDLAASAGRANRQAYVRVRDTGIGIAREFIPHLFDPFRQESTGLSRSYEGTGLGLSIAKRLVDLMGGRIVLESEKGVGSTFTIYFPACERTSATGPGVDCDPSPLPQSSKARVLLVEDNEDSRDFIQTLLDDASDIMVAVDAEKAIACAREAAQPGGVPFDLVLLDINLGSGPNGLDVVRTLRSLPAYESTPILALTAYALPGDREYFIEAGFTDYIGKPFTADELIERTSQLLAR